MKVTRIVLTIAGLDPSSGAGLTADLKVFAAHGLYGVCCPTALTVQSTQGVFRSEAVPPDLIADTLSCLAEDVPLAGIKIGMLGSCGAVCAVADWLSAARFRGPVVVDPVLRSSSGRALLPDDALPALRERLLPLATVITPNQPEAAVLAGEQAAPETLAEALLAQTPAVVLTGGHGPDPDTITDLLRTPVLERRYTGPRVHTSATHGTGCAFSSALLAELVLEQTLVEAVGAAKQYVEQAMRAAYPVGQGRGPMHHLFRHRPKDFTPG